MLVYFSFDDGVTITYYQLYKTLFTNDTRRNPNGCNIRATFYNSHDNTDYNLLSKLYLDGHEFASHTVNHNSLGGKSIQHIKEEIAGQKANQANLGGVPSKEIRGFRAPYLALGGDNMFTVLDNEGFMYDASVTYQHSPPSWPYTMKKPQALCNKGSQTCPSKGFPNIWEVPMNTYYMDSDLTPACSMVDGCRPQTEQEAYEFLKKNFNRHYDAPARPPFGINMHAAWFVGRPHNLRAMERFIDYLSMRDDVWVVPVYKVLQWIQNPTSKWQLNNFAPFQCESPVLVPKWERKANTAALGYTTPMMTPSPAPRYSAGNSDREVADESYNDYYIDDEEYYEDYGQYDKLSPEGSSRATSCRFVPCHLWVCWLSIYIIYRLHHVRLWIIYLE